MKIRAGYEFAYRCAAPVPMLLMVNVHRSRMADLRGPATIHFSAGVVPRVYEDCFGNVCTRLSAPAGDLTIATDFVIEDTGLPDPVVPEAQQHDVADVPDDALVFLLGSRYCETDKLSDTAWSLFGQTPPGWARVQAIVEFVHRHIRFDYACARSTRTAWEAYQEREGVCRDYAHLAVAFCRCMNIPARYCTGYLGDIGVPVAPYPMDFSAWFEVFLGGRWYTFDARHNMPRIGRILMAVGRDATDVAISNSFGHAALTGFFVRTEEVT
ncbi:MAG TPA: transglutaminase family protein, partial [Acetobacteraceae bacterium]|nr:transglutaminase family protein [Acetobacteraceae bacterium]